MLIDEEDNKLGLMSSSQAYAIAQEKEMDLVEVSPLTNPPVCKLMDFGQHLYKQKKIEQKQKQSQKKKSLKTIRLSVRIDPHDLETKANAARKFLEAGNPVKVILIFKGREMQHTELGKQKMQMFINFLEDACKTEGDARLQGNQIFVLLVPQATKVKK